ncbi:MAG: DUF4382 domain-containing protein [Saprospiraceae bacterium]|nr:DUF4382 domain-containing protein [Saprospiraceae bacterium]
MKLARSFNLMALAIGSIPLLFSCSKSDQVTAELHGTIQVEITDAPIDNSEVSGSHVTISAIYLAGDSNILQQDQTIDLLAYQNGNTKNLGLFSVPTGEYDHITIDLNLQEDAFGNTPGCYVATLDGKKHNLYPSTQLLTRLTLPANDLTINPNEKTNLLLDFDLRKLIKHGDQNQIKYQFVEDRKMESGIRVLCRDKTGMIKGVFDSGQINENKILIFAYRQGVYNQTREIKSYSSPSQHFPEATNSAKLQADGSFTIPFLERGTYELVLAAYDSLDGSLLRGILQATGNGGTMLTAINVESGNETSITGKIMGLMPI